MSTHMSTSCLHTCLYTCLHTCLHTCLYTCLHTHLHTFLYKCLYASLHIIHVPMHTPRKSIPMSIHNDTCLYACDAYMYAYGCTHMPLDIWKCLCRHPHKRSHACLHTSQMRVSVYVFIHRPDNLSIYKTALACIHTSVHMSVHMSVPISVRMLAHMSVSSKTAATKELPWRYEIFGIVTDVS